MKYDIGFLGGGQLARMSIQAALRMGLSCLSLDPGETTPASGVADSKVGRLDNPASIAEIFQLCEKVTLENEFIPAESIRLALDSSNRSEDSLMPGWECLSIIQDKLHQRQALVNSTVPGPNAVAIEGDGTSAIERIGFPMVLKARFGGYDGKGTRYAKNLHEFRSFENLTNGGGWMAESFVDFSREVAVMVCRSKSQVDCFPTMVTEQKNHVCDIVYPAMVDASETAIAAVEAIGGYGLFGVEMFETNNGSFLVNEIAPRPHNSGHYTLDWGGLSQFEAHVRLVMGLPLPKLEGVPTCMANLLGQQGAKDFRSAIHRVTCEDPNVRVHWYGKAESRPGRKMGHLNTTGDDCIARARRAQAVFYEAWCQG